MPFPADTHADLSGFYSEHQLRSDGRPTAGWESAHLIGITLPYPMLLAWDLSKTVRKITCHKLVAESLSKVVANILAHYGSEAAVKQARGHAMTKRPAGSMPE
jgi:hypothetical protein